jgi:hypothetical protein
MVNYNTIMVALLHGSSEGEEIQEGPNMKLLPLTLSFVLLPQAIPFNLLEATNLRGSQMGNMQRVTFSFVDPDHHTEKSAMADGKQIGGLLDLRRTR